MATSKPTMSLCPDPSWVLSFFTFTFVLFSPYNSTNCIGSWLFDRFNIVILSLLPAIAMAGTSHPVNRLHMRACGMIEKIDCDTYMTSNVHIRQCPNEQKGAVEWVVDRFFIRRRTFKEYIANLGKGGEAEMANWRDQTDGLQYSLSRTIARPQANGTQSKAYRNRQPAHDLETPHRPRSMHPMIHSLVENDTGAVWAIGNDAFLKISIAVQDVTPEHKILEWISSRDPKPSFHIPRVLHYMRGYDDREQSSTHGKLFNFVFLTRVPGRTLNVAWPGLSQVEKDTYVNEIARKIAEMATWRRTAVGGVDDGEAVMETLLMPRDDGVDNSQDSGSDLTRKTRLDYSKITDTCIMLWMDVKRTVFYHCDLNPTNIIVDMKPSKNIGFIDFEVAGFVPSEWVRTRFAASKNMSWGLNTEDGRQWQKDMHRKLGEVGFSHNNGWKTWSERNHDEMWMDMSPVNSWSSVHHAAPIQERSKKRKDMPEEHGKVRVLLADGVDPPPEFKASTVQEQVQAQAQEGTIKHPEVQVERPRSQPEVQEDQKPKCCTIL